MSLVRSGQCYYVYNELGVVSDWGPPSVHNYLASLPGGGMEMVPAWKTWFTKVWWYKTGHPWFLHCIFYVQHFEEIHRHWDKFFSVGQGHVERIAFEVESYFWSAEGGWEYCDYL